MDDRLTESSHCTIRITKLKYTLSKVPRPLTSAPIWRWPSRADHPLSVWSQGVGIRMCKWIPQQRFITSLSVSPGQQQMKIELPGVSTLSPTQIVIIQKSNATEAITHIHVDAECDRGMVHTKMNMWMMEFQVLPLSAFLFFVSRDI